MAIISYKDSSGNAHWPDCNLNSEKYYGVNWSDYLTAENDTLVSVSWTVPTGLTNLDENQSGNQVNIKLRADTVGDYKVICTLNSIEGLDTQKHIQVMNLKVK